MKIASPFCCAAIGYRVPGKLLKCGGSIAAGCAAAVSRLAHSSGYPRWTGFLALIVLAMVWVPHARAQAQDLAGYTLSPGDVITVTVFGEPDLSLSALRVPGGGVVSYPLIGDVQVIGQTVSSLEDVIAAELRNGYLRRPEVRVSIAEYRPFYIGGAVRSPGAKSYAEGMTVGRAIALAGGIEDDSPLGEVTIERQGGELPGEFNEATPTLPGDVITIKGTDTGRYVYLNGEVSSPGRYKFVKGLNVEKAIVLAGGFTQRASKRKIQISRGSGDQSEKIKRADLGLAIEPDDVITVGASLF